MVSLLSVAFILVSSFIGALGSTIIKKGTGLFSFFSLLKTRYFLGGLFLYGLSIIFYLLALQREELSVIYPLASITYIWITFFSVKLLDEKMGWIKWTGLTGIIIGIVFIGLGS